MGATKDVLDLIFQLQQVPILHVIILAETKKTLFKQNVDR